MLPRESRRHRRRTRPVPGPVPSVPAFPWLPTAGLLLLSVALLTGGPYRQLAPFLPSLPASVVLPSSLAGWVALFLHFRGKTISSPSSDATPGNARLFLGLFLMIGTLLRLYLPDQPPHFAGPDLAHVIEDARNALDLNQHYLFYPYGRREPFFTEWVALLWSLSPEANGVPVVRVATALMDAILVWIAYLLGKEWESRRLGLILAALVATSKPLWLVGLLGCGNTSATLATFFALLFTLRVLRKPDTVHFLQWGVILGVAAYAYMPYRPWAPVLASYVLFRLLRFGQSPCPSPFLRALSLVIWTGTLYLFLERQHFLPRLELPLFMYAGWFWPAWGWTFLALSIGALGISRRAENRALAAWCVGWMTAGILTGPLVLDVDYSTHITGLSVLHQYNQLKPGAESLALLAGNFTSCFNALFGGGLSDIAYTMPENVFFDLLTTVGFFLGLAVLAARDRGKAAGLLALMALGMVPYLLGRSPYSPRLAGAVLPVLVIAGIGLLRLRDLATALFPSPTRSRILMAVGLGIWTGHAVTYMPMMASWFSSDGPNTVLSRCIADQASRHPVFLAPLDPAFYDPGTQRVLNDGRSVRLLSPRGNTLVMDPSLPARDVVVLLSGRDEETKRRLEGDFPDARWTPVETTMPVGGIYAWRALIPWKSLTDDATRLIRRVTLSPSGWRRRLYDGVFGLGRGLIVHEDEVERLDVPLPCGISCVGSVEGRFDAGSAGRYRFRTASKDPIVVEVGGRRILASRDTFTPVRPARASIRLEPGLHPIRWFSYVREGRDFPDVLVTGPDRERETRLGR